MDKAQSKITAKRTAYSQTDAKHLLFVDRKHFGGGYQSFTDALLQRLARELEVALNDNPEYAVNVRARYAAARQNEGERDTENLVAHAIDHHGNSATYLGFVDVDVRSLPGSNR